MDVALAIIVRRMPRRSSRLPAICLALVLALLGTAPFASRAADPMAPQLGRWPIDGPATVVRTFLPPPQPWRPGHRGVDLLTRPGQRVVAPIAGTVEVATMIVDRGVVVIRAGEVRVSLEPVEATVRLGDQVAAGDAVGAMGAGRSHCSPAPCLHWGLRIGKAYHDPLLLVNHYRAVLLP